MRTVLEIYFGVNLFVSAFMLGDDWGFQKETIEKAKRIFWFMLNAFFLIPHVILIIIWFGISWIFNKIDKNGVGHFYLEFYFTRKYCKLDIEALERINATAKKHLTNSPKDCHFRKGVELINRRNNYAPPIQ